MSKTSGTIRCGEEEVLTQARTSSDSMSLTKMPTYCYRALLEDEDHQVAPFLGDAIRSCSSAEALREVTMANLGNRSEFNRSPITNRSMVAIGSAASDLSVFDQKTRGIGAYTAAMSHVPESACQI